MTTPGSPPGRESDVVPSSPGDSPGYNPPETSTAKSAEKGGSEEVLEAEAKPEKVHSIDNKPQPVTQSRASEVQNTDPPITDLELHSNEPDTGSQGGHEDDDVEVIIGPLNKTKIGEIKTNISEVRRAGRESIEKVVKKIEEQKPEKASGQDKARTLGSIQAKIATERTAREKHTSKSTVQKPSKDEEKMEKPATRRREADQRKMENRKKPKKGQTELPPRKIAIEIVDVSDDDAQSGSRGHHDAHAPNKADSTANRTKQKAPRNANNRVQTDKRKTEPRNSPTPKPSQKAPEDDQQTVRAVERKIVSLGPRTEENKKTYDITRKHPSKQPNYLRKGSEIPRGRSRPKCPQNGRKTQHAHERGHRPRWRTQVCTKHEHQIQSKTW